MNTSEEIKGMCIEKQRRAWRPIAASIWKVTIAGAAVGLFLAPTLSGPFGTALAQSSRSASRTNSRAAGVSDIPSDVIYTVEESHVIPGVKRSLDVRLNRKVSVDTLRAIATRLKNSDNRPYTRTFITYWLPGMKIGSGAWASTHFDPSLEVRVYGLLPEEEKQIKTALLGATVNHSRVLIGNWIDEAPFELVRGISLYREKGVLYMDQKFKDASSRRVAMVKNGRRYIEKERSDGGDYYLINPKGDLELRDIEGVISTAKRVE